METYNLKLERDREGIYFIVDQDDEKLRVIAELLLDKQAIRDAKIIIENPHKASLVGPRFHFFNQPDNIIIIKLFEPDADLTDEANPRVINIERLMLDALINGWRDLMKDKPSVIMLSRRHDSDSIQLMQKP